jgi:hypothetical protein
MHGRFDGENFKLWAGDIHDRPYEALTSTVASFDLAALRERPSVRDRMARRACRPLREIRSISLNLDWLSCAGTGSEDSSTDTPNFLWQIMLCCWDKKAIYVGLCAQDVVEDSFYKGKTCNRSTAPMDYLVRRMRKPIRGRVGAGLEPIFDERLFG